MDAQRYLATIVVILVACSVACGAGSAEPDSRTRAAAGSTTPDAATPHAATPHAATPHAATPHVNAAAAPGPAPAGMVWVPGGTFWMGCEGCGMPDAVPAHLVAVDGFWMDRTPVTNAEFERFVTATGYVTVAERPLDPRDFPGVPPDKLVPGSSVFSATSRPVPLDNPLQWWRYTPGANWKRPDGSPRGLQGRSDHPVVHVAFEDVVAYARWANKRLPTEAEFEFAARGGLDRNQYPWGNEMTPDGKAVANTWQGRFPASDRGEDGYTGTSPVTAFPPNGFGLYDMGGNVWQWCADWYRPDTYAGRTQAGVAVQNPHGPAESLDPQEPGAAKRVLRGGSYLCTDQYCARYLVGSRGKAEVTSGASNLGFRLVQSATPVRDVPAAAPVQRDPVAGPPPAYPGYALVWADEFNRAGDPDPKNWTYERGFVRNRELQWYQPENARQADGLLIIEARRERVPNPGFEPGSNDWRGSREHADYTSASLMTKGLHSWRYGRFEMRGRIDTRPGMWPAFWTLGVTGTWPHGGEIDIMEYYRGVLLANVAWGGAKRFEAIWADTRKPLESFGNPAWSREFHVWRMDWDERAIVLSVDGQRLNEVDLNRTVNQDGTGVNPFHHAQYLLLNLAIGGTQGGDPSSTSFPARYEVDYVRVYQRTPAPGVKPPAPNGSR